MQLLKDKNANLNYNSGTWLLGRGGFGGGGAVVLLCLLRLLCLDAFALGGLVRLLPLLDQTRDVVRLAVCVWNTR